MSNGDQQPPPAPGYFASEENDAQTIAKLATKGYEDAGWFGKLWRTLFRGAGSYLLDAIDVVAFVVDKIFALMGKFFSRAQGEQNPAFWELVAAVTEDITGVHVDADKLKNTRHGSGRIDVMEEVGRQIFDLLAQEFLTPPGTTRAGPQTFTPGSGIGGLPGFKISPEQGVEAARRFLGYAMTFAVREANVGVLSELATIGYLKNFRDFGENMATNLAIGRQMRIALRPLFQIAIADPLTQALNKQYSPHLFSEAQIVQLTHAGTFDRAALLDELERLGYDAQHAQALVEILKTHVAASDMELLERFGVLTHAEAVQKLATSGMSQDDAELQLKVLDLRRLDVLVRAQADLAQKLTLDGVYSTDQLRSALDALPITEQEKRLRQVLTATQLENPTKFLTLAEMQSALTQGIVDVTELDDYLEKERYSADDATILKLLSLLKTEKAEEAATAAAARKKAAADKAAAKAKASKPKP